MTQGAAILSLLFLVEQLSSTLSNFVLQIFDFTIACIQINILNGRRKGAVPNREF